jgi:hypothetical protein
MLHSHLGVHVCMHQACVELSTKCLISKVSLSGQTIHHSMGKRYSKAPNQGRCTNMPNSYSLVVHDLLSNLYCGCVLVGVVDLLGRAHQQLAEPVHSATSFAVNIVGCNVAKHKHEGCWGEMLSTCLH